MFGPFFFHGSITGQSYHDMLSEWLVPQMQQAGIKDTVALQLDGAPPHFALHAHDYLNETFPGSGLEEVQKLHRFPLPGLQEVPI
jgi:hypothetical protein